MAVLLKQSTAVDIKMGPFLDSVDGNTQETALTITQPDIRLAKNGAVWAQKNAVQTLTHEEAGWYEVSLDATDTNTLGQLIVAIHETGALPVWREFQVVPANVYDALVDNTDKLQTDIAEWLGTAAATPTVAGVPEVDVTHFGGTAGTFTTGKPDVQTVNALAANVITATAINAAAITSAKFAAGAVDANALAADAVTEIRSVASGTSDAGGTTTTMVDAARTEADTDYWKGDYILFTSGTVADQCRLITGFNLTTDTITFAPATTQTIGAGITYEILPSGRVDLQNWLGAVVNALIAGRVDANMQASGTASITAGSFGAGAIDAAAIANGAIDAATFAAGAIDAAAIANGAIDAATFAAGAIDAAAIATGAIDADALAADAANEIRDAVWAQTMTELAAVPGVTASMKNALEWLFVLSRNKVTQTSTTQLVRNDADTATIGTSTLSDDATTFIRGEFA